VKRRAFLCTCVAASAISTTPGFSQTMDLDAWQRSLQWFRDQVSLVVRNSRILIRPFLTEAEKRMERDIEYRVVLSGNCNAHASSIAGKRTIVLSAGLFQVLSWVADAYNAEGGLGMPGAFGRYLAYVTSGIARNTLLASQQRQPEAVLDFFTFARGSQCNCGTLDPRAFQRSEIDKNKMGIMDASIFFIFAHELAHHVLGHVDDPPTTLSESRRNEAAADAWAFKHGYIARSNPVGAMPTFFFLASFSGSSIEDERLETHPLGIRRFQSMLHAMRSEEDADPSFAARLTATGGNKADYDADIAKLGQSIDKRMRDLGLN